jgi:hypothetical protein
MQLIMQRSINQLSAFVYQIAQWSMEFFQQAGAFELPIPT